MKKFLIAPVLCIAILGTACSTSWVAVVNSILVAAAPALINILQIAAVANGKPMDANLASKIATDSAAIKTMAADFAKDGSTNVCTALQNTIATYQADQSLVLQVAQVSDSKTQIKITELATLISGTVSAITAAIPSCQSPASVAMKLSGPPLKARQFVKAYNKVLAEHTGNAGVDAITPKLKLHEHSAMLRYASAGYLK